MSQNPRISGPHLFAATAALLCATFSAAAQTAPQLLPYTAKLVAGGGSTAATVGAVCQRGTAPNVTASGNTAYDTYGDGCLATEIPLGTGTAGPRYAIADANGVVYFSDYNNGLVRRVDPLTGIVTAIVGGGTNSTTCGTKDNGHTVAAGDLFNDGCLGTAVKLGKPTALVFSPTTGDLYISDTYNYNVRKMSMSNGGVAGVVISSGGSGYTAATVTFSAPAAGTTATGTVTLSGGIITGVTITHPGSGYTTAPTVTFSPSQGGLNATGNAVYTGVMSMVAGSYNGGSTSAKGYSAGCNAAAPASTSLGSTCLLDAPYGLAFDAKGDLYIAEEYYESILVLNTGTASNTIYTGAAAINLAPQILTSIAGARTPASTGAAPGPCLNGTGTTSTSGCNYGNYTSGIAATANFLDAPYGVALDSNNNIYVADEYNNAVAQISSSTSYLNNFAGLYPGTGTGIAQPATNRGAAGFTQGSDFGIAVDAANNTYITDSLAGYLWRIDSPTLTEYVVGGGGTVCASSIDAFGDGCPARQATFSKSCSGTAGCPTNGYSSTGIFGVSADTNGNVFVGDEGNGLVREIASGIQFGPTGASATDSIDIHFAAGDAPAIAPAPSTAAGTTYTVAAPSTAFSVVTTNPATTSIFTLGTAACTVNIDNNGTGNTTDCVLPVTAAPSVSGSYTGTLTVKSANVPAGKAFPLTGYFAQSPLTRTSLTFNAGVSCTGTTTYSTTTPITLTASVTANGPNPPSGNITFTATSGTTVIALGTLPIGNLGTATSPVYGATLPYTFATPGTYTLSATYSGDTTAPVYFTGSTGKAASTLTTAPPSYSLIPIAYQQGTVKAGQTGLFSFNVAQIVYSGTISFAVTGLPANSSYTLSPQSVTGAGCTTSNTVALSINTQQQTTVTPGGLDGSGRGTWRAVSIVAGLGLALLIGLRRRRLPLRFSQSGLAIAMLLTAASITGCGKGVGTVLQPATPSGTYTIMVAATGTTGTAPAPVTFTLIVQ